MHIENTVLSDTQICLKQNEYQMFNSHKKFELSPRLKFGVGRGYSQNQILKVSAALCLLLAIGLTFNAVRLLFSKETNTMLAAPQVLGATDNRQEQQVPAVEFIEYKVQKGDTLFNISQKHNIEWGTLATLNNMKSPFTVKPGQVMKIPK